MLFVPDYRFDKFDDISPDFLLSIGVRGVLLDIDNTLEPYENSDPGIRVVNWLDSLKTAGINAGFVSNNDAGRVERFNKDLGLPAYSKAKKPFKKYIMKALVDIDRRADECVFIGDQVFTDVWAARNAGLKAILLPPIKDKRDLFTRFKRLLERPFLRKYDKKMKNEDKENDKA